MNDEHMDKLVRAFLTYLKEEGSGLNKEILIDDAIDWIDTYGVAWSDFETEVEE